MSLQAYFILAVKIKQAVETLLRVVAPNQDTAETLRKLIAPKHGAA